MTLVRPYYNTITVLRLTFIQSTLFIRLCYCDLNCNEGTRRRIERWTSAEITKKETNIHRWLYEQDATTVRP